MQEIKNPYKFICDYAEEVYPFAGRKVFEVASLIPPSLILPDLPYKGKKIRSNINILILSPPSSGKSQLSNLFSCLTYNPINYRSVTSAKLITEINENPLFSLIVEDLFTMSRDPILLKVVEGIIGDEKRVQRATMRKEIETATEGIGFFCGVPSDLSEYLTGGVIFRMVPILLFHNEEEHSSIGKAISESIGEEGDYDQRENIIREHYLKLFKIQSGDHEIKKIIGYNIPKGFKEEVFKKWDEYTKRINRKTGSVFNWFREEQEAFRFMICHAFLNVEERELVYNEKSGGNVLHLNEEDLNVGIALMKKELAVKAKLLSLENFMKSISAIKNVKTLADSIEFKEEDKKLLELIMMKKGR